MWKHHILGFMLCTIVMIVAVLTLQPNYAAAEQHSWGFTRSKDGLGADAGAKFESILERYGAFYKGNPNEKVVYLTFDNGFEAGYTEGILDTLRKENVPATFFLVGHYIDSAPELVKQMVKDGHIIGNHSYKHPNMAKLSDEAMVEEWRKFDEALKELTGIKRTYYARPPEGVFSERMLELGNKNGYTHMFWSIAFKDWDTDKTHGKEYAYNHLMNQLHPGAIILMHTVSKHNADALPDFIREAKKQGYRFESLDNLVMEYHLNNWKWDKWN
ncbi:polysaccharide deacetylase family protein [Ureibacillus composti]|nr:polysaccharide deacetylase family protein [Ureibacillus composti]